MIFAYNYKQARDIRAKWKSYIRKYPFLTRFAQFLFDPAYVSNRYRNSLLKSLEENALILNIGAGVIHLPFVKAINLDIEPYGNVSVVGDAQLLPFHDNGINAVILEYTIEHVPVYSKMIYEINRVLKKGGYVYITVPFLQSYHGNPDDYWRVTQSGLSFLFRDFDCIACKPFGGPTSALICMLKEYLAILLSFNSSIVYSILSQLLILPFIPFRYLDILLCRSKNAHNACFSLCYIGRKR